MRRVMGATVSKIAQLTIAGNFAQVKLAHRIVKVWHVVAFALDNRVHKIAQVHIVAVCA